MQDGCVVSYSADGEESYRDRGVEGVGGRSYLHQGPAHDKTAEWTAEGAEVDWRG